MIRNIKIIVIFNASMEIFLDPMDILSFLSFFFLPTKSESCTKTGEVFIVLGSRSVFLFDGIRASLFCFVQFLSNM